MTSSDNVVDLPWDTSLHQVEVFFQVVETTKARNRYYKGKVYFKWVLKLSVPIDQRPICNMSGTGFIFQECDVSSVYGNMVIRSQGYVTTKRSNFNSIRWLETGTTNANYFFL